MNADSVSFRFPSMLVFGHEADELDLIDQFIPVRLGLGIGKVRLLDSRNSRFSDSLTL